MNDSFNMTSELLAVIQKQDDRIAQIDKELFDMKIQFASCEKDRLLLTGQVVGLTKKFVSLNKKVLTLQKKHNNGK